MLGALIGGAAKILTGGRAGKIIGGIGRGIGKLIGGGRGTKIVKAGTAVIRDPRVQRAGKVIAGAAATGGAFEVGSRVVRSGGTDVAVNSPTVVYHGGGGGAEMFGMMPFIVEPEYVERARAPRGYVIVSDPNDPTGETKIAMLKKVATALGLHRPRARGGISSRDIRAAKRVQRLVTSLTVNRQPRVKLRAKRGR